METVQSIHNEIVAYQNMVSETAFILELDECNKETLNHRYKYQAYYYLRAKHMEIKYEMIRQASN